MRSLRAQGAGRARSVASDPFDMVLVHQAVGAAPRRRRRDRGGRPENSGPPQGAVYIVGITIRVRAQGRGSRDDVLGTAVARMVTTATDGAHDSSHRQVSDYTGDPPRRAASWIVAAIMALAAAAVAFADCAGGWRDRMIGDPSGKSRANDDVDRRDDANARSAAARAFLTSPRKARPPHAGEHATDEQVGSSIFADR